MEGHRFELLEEMLRTARLVLPSPAQVEQYRLNAIALGDLLLSTWGKTSGKKEKQRYHFRFYDHVTINHVHGQLAGLLAHSTWFLKSTQQVVEVFPPLSHQRRRRRHRCRRQP